MKFISCIKWVKKGVSQNIPDNINLEEDDLNNLIQNIECEHDDQEEVKPNTDTDVNDEYDLKNYDEENDDLRATLKGIVDLDNNVKGKKLKRQKRKLKKQLNNDTSDSEREDDVIKDDDNLLIVGRVDEYSNSLDIYIYNENDGDMYIHHDLMLKHAPLCVEWLNVETFSGLNNICAVGTMNPVIELWDLDIMNCVEPVSKLGRKKKKNSHKNFGHSDTVLTVAWNSELPHILCSGSVDTTALLWDLESGKVATEINIFTDKVQNVLWNPHSPYHLLTACADTKVRNFDCRLYDEYQQFELDSAVESIVWDPCNEYICYAGTETGKIYNLDFRSKIPVLEFSAHKKEVTGLAVSKRSLKTLISVSTDECLKLWDIDKSNMTLLYEEDVKLGALHCIDSNPDYPHIVCAGGSSKKDGELMKVINLNKYELKASKRREKWLENDVTFSSVVPLLEEKQESQLENKKIRTKKRTKNKQKKIKLN